jgi:AcrR family transcriptional regulator
VAQLGYGDRFIVELLNRLVGTNKMASKDETRSRTLRLRPGPNGLPRGQVTEIQRSRMLTATVEAVEDVGYAGLTVAQVISRAKVSRKTFYDVFTDREDCFLAAFDQAIAQARVTISEAYDSQTGWRESLRAGLFALLVFLDDEPGLARLCVVEALGAGPRVLDRRAEVLDDLKEVVDRGRTEGGTRSARSTSDAPNVTAEGVVGAVFAVIHTRLLGRGRERLTDLLGPLMSMIVLPYLGARVASNELTRRPPKVERPSRSPQRLSKDPLEGLEMRLTYRTVRVLTVIGDRSGASNREIAEESGISDQGQISKLLTRLERLDLVRNTGEGQVRGASNAWHLTERGAQVERATRPR